MPSRREQVRMPPEEMAAYLAAGRRIILVTNGPDGMPHPVPMNYGLDGEGRVVLSSFARSQKVRNLERDPRASLLLESGHIYAELKGAIAYARAEIVREPDEVAALMRLIRAETPLAESIGPQRDEQVRASIAKRVAIRLTPFRFVSWDHARLGGFY